MPILFFLTAMTNFSYDPYSVLNQKLIDAAVTAASFYLAYQLRFEWQLTPDLRYAMLLMLLCVVVGRVAFASVLKSYKMIWRYMGLADAINFTLRHSVFSFALALIHFTAPDSFKMVRLPLSIILLENLLSLLGSLGARAGRRLIYEGWGNGTKGRRVILIGAGRTGVMVVKGLGTRTDLQLKGFLDDDPKKIGAVICGLPVLGSVGYLSVALQRQRIEEVVITMPRPPRNMLKRVWAVCDHFGVRVRIVPTLDEILRGDINLAAFRDVDMEQLIGRDPVQLPHNEPALMASYSQKCILITGAGGSIGSELACQLLRLNPRKLVLLDKDENGLFETCMRLQQAGHDSTPIVADLRFPQRVKSVLATYRPDVIFHAAAHKHVHLMEVNPCEAIVNNVTGTRTLVEQASVFGVKTFVQISTDKAVNPTSVMGASKRICEMIVQARQHHSRTLFCCVRFGNVLGSRGSVVPIFQQQIAQGGPVTVTHSAARRFLMTIPEAVNLLIRAGSIAKGGEIFVLDMGEPVVIEQLAENLIEQSGLRPGKDVQIEFTRLTSGEKLSEKLIDESHEVLRPTRFPKISVIISSAGNGEILPAKLLLLEEAAARDSAEEVQSLLSQLRIGFRTGDTSVPSPELEAATLRAARA